jgi:hypothetical protein
LQDHGQLLVKSFVEREHQTHSSPSGRRLTGLLELGLTSAEPRGDGELAAEFEYCLAQPFGNEWRCGAEPEPQSRAAEGTSVSARTTFASVLQDPLPSIHFLLKVKEFAKECLRDPNSCLPRPTAAAIYYLAIGTALWRLNLRISDLSDEEMRRGFDWALTRQWLDPQSREALTRATRCLAEK